MVGSSQAGIRKVSSRHYTYAETSNQPTLFEADENAVANDDAVQQANALVSLGDQARDYARRFKADSTLRASRSATPAKASA